MPRELPGFYYDEAKGKYFRIQQNHRVVAGTGYTRQSVKAAKEAKQDERRLQYRSQRQRAGKIVRSKLLQHTTSLLSTRLGAGIRQNKNEVVRQYGAGLSCSRIALSGKIHGSSFAILPSGTLCISHQLGPRSSWKQQVGLTSPHFPFRALLDVGSVLPGPLATVCPFGQSDGSQRGVLLSNGSPHILVRTIGEDAMQPPDVFIEHDLQRVRHCDVETIWDIATSPTSDTAAIATDAGLISCSNHITTFSDLAISRNLRRKEQMNVTFKDRNVIMSGERSGRINFTDPRVGESVTRLLHSSAVLGTVALHGGNHILAHGFSTTCIYDLRFMQQHPVHGSARSSNVSQHSKAYIKFAVARDRTSTHYSHGRKLAYSADLDVVAAASSSPATYTGGRENNFVTLYSASTGRVVDSPLTRHVYKDAVTSVEIRRVRDGPESVFCLSADGLDEWRVGMQPSADVVWEGNGGGDCAGSDAGLYEYHDFEREWELSNDTERWGSWV